jgi:REP element-mobilizing transposase RayT
MAEAYTVRDQQAIHFVTFTIVDWIDVFTRKIYKDICINSLDFCRKNKGLKIYSYVIMSNHIHLIVQAENYHLSDIIRDFKKYTSKRIIETIETIAIESRKEWILSKFEYNAKKHMQKSKYQVWQRDSHAEELISTKFIEQKKNYIHQNPVRAGIVQYEYEYLYSSARNYAELSNELEIDFV